MNELEELKTICEQLATIETERARIVDQRAALITGLLNTGARMLDVQIATGLSAARIRVIRDKYEAS